MVFMKKNVTIMMMVVAGAMLMASCSLFEKENHLNVDESLLYGKWQEGTSQIYWRYLDDGSGVTWDEGEDISEEESNLTYTWTLRGDVLTHVFTGAQDNQAVPKVYTITEIDDSKMVWKDDYGLTKTLNKMQ